MSLYQAVSLGLALSGDAFSVSLLLGIKRPGASKSLLISLLVGSLHILLPLMGFYLGHYFELFLAQRTGINAETLPQLTSALGAGLLILLGGVMIFEASSEGESLRSGLWQGMGLLLLAFSVSIDALTVGVGLGMMHRHPSLYTLILGLIAFMMVLMGLGLGDRLGSFLGLVAEYFGGLILILMGLLFLF